MLQLGLNEGEASSFFKGVFKNDCINHCQDAKILKLICRASAL